MNRDQFDPPNEDEDEPRVYHDYDHANWIVPVVFIICVTIMIVSVIIFTTKGK